MTGILEARSRVWRLGVVLIVIAAMLILAPPEAGAIASSSVAADISYSNATNATYEDHVVKHRARHGAHRPRSERRGTGFVPVKRHFQPV